MKIQEVDFGSWHRWKNRNIIENSEEPSIYALGKFEITPPEKADLLDRRIIYFGETCKSLKARWNQFDRTAFQPKEGHSGGKSYRRDYPGDKGQDLYVAAMPILRKRISNKGLRDSYIQFIERKLIFDYVKEHNELPRCNQK